MTSEESRPEVHACTCGTQTSRQSRADCVPADLDSSAWARSGLPCTRGTAWQQEAVDPELLRATKLMQTLQKCTGHTQQNTARISHTWHRAWQHALVGDLAASQTWVTAAQGSIHSLGHTLHGWVGSCVCVCGGGGGGGGGFVPGGGEGKDGPPSMATTCHNTQKSDSEETSTDSLQYVKSASKPRQTVSSLPPRLQLPSSTGCWLRAIWADGVQRGRSLRLSDRWTSW